MKARCVHDVSSELADHQRGRFAERELRYDLTPGGSYVIMGMGIWEAVLHVLVRDDLGAPFWFPIGLFDIPEQPLPSGWRFTPLDGLRLSGREAWGHCVALWSYRELISNPRHTEGLSDRDPEALATFEHEYLKAGGERDGPEGYAGPWPGWPAS